MKNLIVRSISGAVYVALIVCSILFGGYWAFPFLCGIFAFAGIFEFQKMTQADIFSHPRALLVDLLVGFLLPVSVVLFMTGLYPVAALLILILVMLRFVAQLYVRTDDSVRCMANSIMSVVYVALPLMAAALVFSIMGAEWALLMFVLIWLNDTGAFLVGSAIGRHRLFERLSPKKSWEGFFGGLLFCVAAGCLAKVVFPAWFGGYPMWMLACVGVVVCVMATWGDLFESMIKRCVGVKDSGSMIPGHGGILDRIDSLLFVAPSMLIGYGVLLLSLSFAIIKG